MTGISNHMIQHAKLDFQFNGSTDGAELQQEVYDWFEQLMKQVEPQFSRLAEEEYYYINELVLDADVNRSDWKADATARIMLQLNDKIRLMRGGVIHTAANKVHTVQHHFENVFFYYLRYGYLPWNVNTYSLAQWEKQIEEMLVNSNDGFVLSLLNVLAGNNESKIRFIESVSFTQLIKLFKSRQTVLPENARQILNDTIVLHDQIAKVSRESSQVKVLYRYFLTTLAAGEIQLQLPQIANTLQVLKMELLQIPVWEEIISGTSFRSPAFKLLQSPKEKEKIKSGKVYQNPGKSSKQQFIQNQMGEDDITEAVYISNAGLVIIAAFLPAFFTKAKLLAKNELTDFNQAACLINYMVTGSSSMQEFDLVLPKILCGLSLHHPLETSKFRISKLLKKEVEEVLHAVIEYWSILQNTSVEGLRESFLKRKGKISFKNNEWLLQVEQQPYDMLLQHLPWNISMIQLPWMKQMLKTEWVY
jgi:hypothetical protein